MSSSTTDAAAPAGHPGLSVVVASFSDGALLYQCLDALAAQVGAEDLEIIVVRDRERTDGFDRASAARRFPRVRWIDAPSSCTVPRLRGLGIAASRGDAVALLEDDCLVQEGWSRAAMSVLDSPVVALGGVVEPGPYTRALDWGVYFCEYARFMRPVSAVESSPLPGNNTVYKRSALLRLNAGGADGFEEVFAQAEWRRAGLATTVSNALAVRNVNSWPMDQVTVVPFHHGRAFAANRFKAAAMPLRVAIALATLGLPALKIVRLFRETLSRGRLTGRLTRSLPWILAFTVCWSVGEAVGCTFGPGTSRSRWR